MKKLLALSLVGLMTLSGCNKTDNTPKSDTTTATSTQASTPVWSSDTSNLPANAPTYTMAIDPTYPPFALKDEKGQAMGLDIDILKAIGEKQGFKIQLVPRPWTDIFQDLNAKKFDIIGSGVGSSEQMATSFSQSKPFIQSSNILISNASAPINSVADIKGKKIGTTADSDAHDLAKSLVAQPSDLVIFDSSFLALQGLIQGKVQGVADDELVLTYFTKNLAKQNLKFHTLNNQALDPTYKTTPNDGIVFVMHKTNTELLTKINTGIDQIKADGTYDKIVKKWLGDVETKAVLASSPVASTTK